MTLPPTLLPIENALFAPMSCYTGIYLTLKPPLGKYPYESVEEEIEEGTGTRKHLIHVKLDGKSCTYEVHAPTMIGLGPSIARKERQRLLDLRDEVEKALEQVDGFLSFFDKK